jgi:serine/threonine protein kinase
MVAMAVQQV